MAKLLIQGIVLMTIVALVAATVDLKVDGTGRRRRCKYNGKKFNIMSVFINNPFVVTL